MKLAYLALVFGVVAATNKNNLKSLEAKLAGLDKRVNVAKTQLKEAEGEVKAFANGMKGDEDLGLKMRVGGDHVKINKKQVDPSKQAPFAEGMEGDENLKMKMRVGADHVKVNKKTITEQK